jgi:N-acetyl-alpha-D-muramate 1-phosphate uridylyltransferase
MEAMILAAGRGTRLRPVTDLTPKALLPVGGRSLLAKVMDRLIKAGVRRIIVNTHHHAGQVRAFLADHTPPGVEVVLSPEPDGPYDTGGGLLAAAPLFRREGVFLLHNVDVLSRIPLGQLLAAHRAERVHHGERLLATLAVQTRGAARQLLFDDAGLMGREIREGDGSIIAEHAREPVGALRRFAFAGIHAIEPALLDLTARAGRFSIITWYLDLASRGYVIQPFDASAYDWTDVGTPERLAEAEARGW